MRCDECKHWDNTTKKGWLVQGSGVCKEAVLFASVTMDREPDWRKVLKKEALGKKVFVQDADDYLAWMVTMFDFGCVQFDPK